MGVSKLNNIDRKKMFDMLVANKAANLEMIANARRESADVIKSKIGVSKNEKRNNIKS